MPKFVHAATILQASDVQALVHDCLVDDAQQVTLTDGHVLNGWVATKLFETTLVVSDGVWKVSENALLERWEGRGGCTSDEYALIAAFIGRLLLDSSGPAGAEVGEHTGGSKGGAVIVGGTPVAIAIAAPSGTVASWERRGGGSGPRWTCGYFGFEKRFVVGRVDQHRLRQQTRQPIPGQIYGLLCRDQAGDLVYSWFGVYDPADPFAGFLPVNEPPRSRSNGSTCPTPSCG